MADHTKVVVYIRAKDVRMLRERNISDPAMWARATIKDALAAEQQALQIVSPGIAADYADSAE